MNYKCIIFDCDGVLVDTEVTSNQVFVDLLKPYKVQMSLEEAIKKFSGSSLSACIKNIEDHFEIKLSDSFEQEFRDAQTVIFKKDGVPAIPGIHELIDNISAPYCVASSGPQEKMAITLKSAELLEHFEGKIFSSYDINSWKPEPGIFLHAAEQMGFDPSECVVIEDSLVGVQAALAGGFDVFSYDQHGKNDEQHDLSTKSFTHMDQLHEWLV